MNLKSHGISRKDTAFSVLLFAAFSLLVYLFPYSGDDWAWGSQLGVERLETWFDNYNGRYLGNLLVMVLTRSELVNILLTAFSLVCFCLFPKLFVRSEKFLLYALGALFFFLMPRPMKVQAVVWTSGFSNYVPPILLIFLYLILVQNIFDEGRPEYGRKTVAIAPFIGFAAGLFMENVTLYNLAAAAAVLVIAYIRFRKVYAVHLAYLGGSVLGALAMFTNSAYGFIAEGGDEYRSTVLDEGLIRTLSNNTNMVLQEFFLKNMAAWGLFSVLCLVCCVMYVRSGKGNKLCRISAGVHIVCWMMLAVKSWYPNWLFLRNFSFSGTITVWIFALIAVGYCLSALVQVLFCVEEQRLRLRVLFLLVSIPVLVAPLLVVNPVSSRCLLSAYLMLAAACVVLLAYIRRQLKLSVMVERGLAVVALAGCAAVLCSLVSVYLVVHRYDCLRNEYVQKQVEMGYQEVTISELPYESYVWCSRTEGIWEERYKMFYGIDQNVKFRLVNCATFDAWMKDFDESNP